MSEGLTVTLPEDLTRAVEEGVARGRFASAEEAVREAVQALIDEDAAETAWLKAEVGPVYDRHKAGLGETVTLDEAFDRLKAEVVEVFDRDVRGEEPSFTAEEVFGGLAASYAARRKVADEG